ncbi:MAG: FAD-dependent oxidoreductase [bacterium]|nr:FAD-dependent oxidoreductase [bacterium]MCP4800694.1 FAD-dependent oxidoreductase [bacterium]
MAKIVIGAWNELKVDNRGKQFFEIEDFNELVNFNEFDQGNRIKAFFGGRGFFVFDKDISVLGAISDYLKKSACESCGKCTPCRSGLRILTEKLDTICDENNYEQKIAQIRELAEHISLSSLCGLGQTATVPLLQLLDNFPDVVEKEVKSCAVVSNQPGHSYLTAPCIEECPSKVDVPRYIDYIKDGKHTHSVGVVLQKYPMAATCGRVCVRFCEMACRRTQVDDAVGIKVLKRFVADQEKYATEHWFSKDLITDPKQDDLKVAVIGAGPSGISAAYHLLLKGYRVEIFEAMTEPGGMAAVGIPEYRLPKEEILRKEISIIEDLGGKIHYDQRMGRDFALDILIDKGFKSVFLGVGAHKGKEMGVPGEENSIQGYISGVKFLLFINHYHINIGVDMDLGDKMIVVGGGNVAMDCVRSALRMGVKEVHLVYRRSRNEMPADIEEIEAAEHEGVIFHYLTHPTKVISEDGKVVGLELIKMELGKPDQNGRAKVTPVDGSEFTLETDFVVPAIGQKVDHSFISPDEGIEFNSWGLIDADEQTLQTSRRGVFAGGDAVTGPATLIEAMAQGHQAAESIDDYLTYGRPRFHPERRFQKLLKEMRELQSEDVDKPIRHLYRVKVDELDPEIRKRKFEEVEKPISLEAAYHEAGRCMRCYRVYSVVTEK